MDIVSVAGTVLFTAAVKTIKELLIKAVSERADLRGANLCGADLRGADLYGADLRGADLYGADLCGADLRGADLCGADLRGADLYGADLYGADLYGANLYGANLYGADLYGANLYGANLYGANLYGANDEKKKVHTLRAFSSSLYPYVVLAVLFEDGERFIQMGCLRKTLVEWKKIGIRKSNESEFPDDKSEKCEDRVGLFNLAKAAVSRMKLDEKK